MLALSAAGQCSAQAAEIRIKELHTLLILLRRTEFTIKLTFLNITSEGEEGEEGEPAV